jgi:hypothetical protein
VNAEAIKIGKEAEEANAIASECQAGLDKALPALQAAEDALNVLTKKDMSELKVSPAWLTGTCNCLLSGTMLRHPSCTTGIWILLLLRSICLQKPWIEAAKAAALLLAWCPCDATQYAMFIVYA